MEGSDSGSISIEKPPLPAISIIKRLENYLKRHRQLNMPPNQTSPPFSKHPLTIHKIEYPGSPGVGFEPTRPVKGQRLSRQASMGFYDLEAAPMAAMGPRPADHNVQPDFFTYLQREALFAALLCAV